MKKILVTGATGYIGKKLVQRLLNEGCSVHAITRNPDNLANIDNRMTPIHMDLLDISSDNLPFDISTFDVIYHCAGELYNESIMEKLHVHATSTLIAALTNQNTKWIQLSSVGVYGGPVKGVIKEDSIFSPIGMYEITKAKAEIQVKKICRERNIEYSIIRPSTVFSYDMPNNSIKALIKTIKQKNFFYFGHPENVYLNYVHVNDVVDLLMFAKNKNCTDNNEFIISSPILLKEFIAIVCEISEVNAPKIIIPKAMVNGIAKLFGNFSFFPLTESRVKALTSEAIYSDAKLMECYPYRDQNTLKNQLIKFIENINYGELNSEQI